MFSSSFHHSIPEKILTYNYWGGGGGWVLKHSWSKRDTHWANKNMGGDDAQIEHDFGFIFNFFSPGKIILNSLFVHSSSSSTTHLYHPA